MIYSNTSHLLQFPTAHVTMDPKYHKRREIVDLIRAHVKPLPEIGINSTATRRDLRHKHSSRVAPT